MAQHVLKDTWTPTQTKPQVRVAYQANKPDVHPEFVSKHVVGQLVDFLMSLSKAAHDSGFMDSIAIWSGPNGVTVTAAIPVGKLML
eukprot:5637245-Pyramimonas_sp.AAC.1